MLIANGFFFIKHIWNFCNTFAVAATFSILNVDVSFLHPNVGFPLAKSKNLTFSCRYKVFYASLPASCCFVSDIFAVPTLSIRFFKCFERLHLQFEVSTFGVWFHVQFYDIQNSRNRIFAFTIITQTCRSIKSLNYCWKSLKEKSLWLSKKKSTFHLIPLFEDYHAHMEIWTVKVGDGSLYLRCKTWVKSSNSFLLF